MSHFVCPKCGMTNIDCGRDGYKTEREIELEQQVKCLQEQLKEANHILKDVFILMLTIKVNKHSILESGD